MKKAFSILSLSLLVSIVSCKKDKTTPEITNISSTYKMVLFEYTATWCGPCGSNAFDAFDVVNQNNSSIMCGISIHPSDGVSSGNAAGQAELKTFFGFAGTPQAAVNHNKKFGFPSDVNANKQTLQNHANTAKGVKAKAGIGISKSVVGNSLEIKTKTVFFEDIAGNYNLAVYVVENGLMANQTSHTPALVAHNHVFRGAANGVWGKKLATGSASKGSVVDDTFVFPIPSDVKNRDNLQVVAVIWKMDANEPIEMINSNKE